MRGKEKRTYTMEDYRKVLQLREKEYKFQEIADETSVGRTTCVKWCNTDRKPRKDYARRKEKSPKQGFEELDTTLAYIYGVVIGDGYLERSQRNYRIGLNVTDQEFANKFYAKVEDWTGLEPNISERTVQHDHTTKYGCDIECETHYYQVRLSSKAVLEFLESKGEFKTERWSVPLEVKNSKDEIQATLIRGIFDSEGYSTYSGRTRRIELEMKNRKGLEQLKDLLKQLDIKSQIEQFDKQKEKDTYLFRIYDKESIKNFRNKIGFSINRKQKALKALLDSYKT